MDIINVCDVPKAPAISDSDFKLALSIADYSFNRRHGNLYSKGNLRLEDTPFEYLNFTIKIYSALKHAGFNTVGDIIKDIKNPDGLFRNFKVKDIDTDGFDEILSALKKHRVKIGNYCIQCRTESAEKICANCLTQSKIDSLQESSPINLYHARKFSGFYDSSNSQIPKNLPIEFLKFTNDTYLFLKSNNLNTLEAIINDIEASDSILRNADFDVFNEIILKLRKLHIKFKDVCVYCREFLSSDEINEKRCKKCSLYITTIKFG